MAERADVVIIGGGVIGTSVAFHLAKLGMRDLLLLERSHLAAGSTGRSVGIVRTTDGADGAAGMIAEEAGFGAPHSVAAGYAAAAKRLGARIRTNAPVERVLVERGEGGGVRGAGGGGRGPGGVDA